MNRWGGELSRRDFLIRGSASLAAIAAPPAFAGNRKVIHIIGHSHIDAAWLWPWRDGSDTVLTTFRSALNRMIETPGFCYSHSSSAHYRWVERADPGMFAEIQQRIREGRWEVVGGWPVEPDCNIPSTESFVRHSLYGKAYCQRLSESTSRSASIPIPSATLRACRRSSSAPVTAITSSCAPRRHEVAIAASVLVGGRRRVARSYPENLAWLRCVNQSSFHGGNRRFAPGIDHAAFFLGVGDHGGAVTKEQIRQVVELQKDPNLPELRFSTLRDFFLAVENSPAFASLPVIRGELQHHARGCYSANGEGKFLNRRAERWLGEAETIRWWPISARAGLIQTEQYAEAWWKVLFCQFHDMMAGTSLYSDYQDVRDSVGYACEVAQSSKVEALEIMAKRVDLSAVEERRGLPFQSAPLETKGAGRVLHTGQNPSGKAPITHLASKDGDKIPVQWRPSASMTNFFPRLSAWVELPPCGYKVFDPGPWRGACC